MTPVPSDTTTLMNMEFEIVIMDPVGSGVNSDIGLTHFHPDGYLRG